MRILFDQGIPILLRPNSPNGRSTRAHPPPPPGRRRCSPSPPHRRKGWGEEATFIECPSPRPSPHSCLAGRERKNFWWLCKAAPGARGAPVGGLTSSVRFAIVLLYENQDTILHYRFGSACVGPGSRRRTRAESSNPWTGARTPQETRGDVERQ